MENTRLIIIKSHTPQEKIDEAYGLVSKLFRDLIMEYYNNKRLLISEAINRAGCPNPDVMKNFILTGEKNPTGKDLERLLYHTDLTQTFAKRMPILVGSEVDYWEAIVGTNVTPSGEIVDVDASKLPPSFDRLAKSVLSKTTWFYIQATERYLKEQGLR